MASAKTAPQSNLIKRSEAARLLGMSVSTLRRHEGELLQPVVGPDGVHRFDEAEVRAVTVTLRARSAVAALGPSTGDVAADVFTLLDESVHPIEIVKRLRVPPDVVVGLHEQWARMRGGFTVSLDDARHFGLVARARRPTSAEMALAQLRARVQTLTKMRQGTSRCHSCGDQTASICEACTVRTRGLLSSFDTRTETRTTEEGEEIRVVTEVNWDDVGDFGSSVATMWSDWVPRRELELSSIGDIVECLRLRAAFAQR